MSAKDFKQHMLNELRELERLIRNDCERDNGLDTSYEPEELKWFEKLHELQDLCDGSTVNASDSKLPLCGVSTRYFVVGYIGTMHTGQLTGSINMWSESGYLTRARATQVIEEHNEGIKNVVITNVTELNKEDFEAWRANVC